MQQDKYTWVNTHAPMNAVNYAQMNGIDKKNYNVDKRITTGN